jgi:hypothetical protein
MYPTPRSNALLRLTCAACAVIATTAIGLSIHGLSRHYDVTAAQQAAAQAVVVAQAPSR